MTAASLSLLKGAKKTADPAPEEAKQVEEVATTATDTEASSEEGVTVEVENMTGKQLDELVKEHAIDTPDTWAKMKVGEKRAWLNEQFGDDAGEGTEAEDKAEPETAAHTEATVEEKVEAKAEEAPKTTAKKGKAKAATAVSTAVAKAVEGEIVGSDVFSDLVFQIENMGEKEARELVGTLSDEAEAMFFKLGGVLSVIQANGWYQPYASFREYVEKEHGLVYRKAVYWTAIYNHLAEAKVPWAKVSTLGWTKLKEIAKVVTPENVDEWVKIASGQTTLQLIATVKASVASKSPKAIEDGGAKNVTTKTFKVHEEQKATIEAALTKAKEDGHTQVNTVALEYICMDYLGAESMLSKIKNLGIEAALELVEKAFPAAKITVELDEEAA